MAGIGKLKITVIPGGGIGTEVTAEALKVFKAAIGELDTIEYDLSSRRYLRNGKLLTDADLGSLREHDAILLGAIGDPTDVPPGAFEYDLLLKMRFALNRHVNLHPSRLLSGVESPLENPGEIDSVVVHEGTKGAYTSNDGIIHVDMPHEIANETSVSTRFDTEHVVHHALELAITRRKKLALIHKTNILVHNGDMRQRTVDEVAKECPEVDVGYSRIDAVAIYLVTNSSRFDIIVTDNLFDNIITDEAGAVSGSIGLAASGNTGASNINPSVFEPVHSSAPDITDKGIADPTAITLLSAMMLHHLGREQDA